MTNGPFRGRAEQPCTNAGLAGQRVPIRVPRIRHVAGSEIPLRSYEALHGQRAVNDLLLKRVLYGISCRNYEAAAEAIPGAIGLSGSTVSRTFIQASAAKLRELQERDLAGDLPHLVERAVARCRTADAIVRSRSWSRFPSGLTSADHRLTLGAPWPSGLGSSPLRHLNRLETKWLKTP